MHAIDDGTRKVAVEDGADVDEVEDEPDSVPLEVDDAELDPEVEEEDDEGAWRLTIRACLALTSAAEAIVRRVARAIKAFMMLSGKELLGQTLG